MSFFQPVEYDRLPSLCFRCGKVGHRAETCSSSAAAPVQNSPTSSTHHVPQCAEGRGPTQNPVQEEEWLFGPWMKVQRRKGRIPKKSAESPPTPAPSPARRGVSRWPEPPLDQPTPAHIQPHGPYGPVSDSVPALPTALPKPLDNIDPNRAYPRSNPNPPSQPPHPPPNSRQLPEASNAPVSTTKSSSSLMLALQSAQPISNSSSHNTLSLSRQELRSPTVSRDRFESSTHLSPSQALDLAKQAFMEAEKNAMEISPPEGPVYEDPDLRQALIPWTSSNPQSSGDKKKGGGLHLHPKSSSVVIKRQKTRLASTSLED